MATSALKGITLRDSANPNSPEVIDAPEWLRNPATVEPIKKLSDFNDRANAYFSDCVDREKRPTITGLALATGLPGPTSLIRLGQRVPVLRHVISRCMTAVAHGYEELISDGYASAGPQFMLKNIPDFDPDDPEGSPGVQFFNDRKEILLQATVHGAASTGEDYDNDVDPVEVYMNIVKKAGQVRLDTTESSLQLEARSTPQQRLFTILSAEDCNEQEVT